MNEELYIKRDIYREIFNNLCADYSIYRLNHQDIDSEFKEMEKKLWQYRKESLQMNLEDCLTYDKVISKANAYLVRKELFR